MIEFLAWDSDFLGFKTGRIGLNDTENIELSLSEARKSDFKLVYVFDDNHVGLSHNLCAEFDGARVDRKLIFTKAIHDPGNLIFEQVFEYDEISANQELIDLALESGQYSRFRTDKHFKNTVFEAMYQMWIEKSVEKELADYVFVTKTGNQLAGMVTLRIQKDTASIGLIAVSPDFQGKGYGRQLINKCENIASLRQCKELIVPTQAENTQACTFYQSCGFKTEKETDIYHFWL